MVSYEYHDYPDATQECCLCHRYDCSTGDEKWLHLLTVETDGGYSPAIGHKCLSEIVANGEFAKAEPVKEVVTREPTDAEIGAFVRQLSARGVFELSEPVVMNLGGVPSDDSTNHDHLAGTRTRGNARQRKSKVGEGTR